MSLSNIGKCRSAKSWSLELNFKDEIWNKNVHLYRKTRVGKSTNSKRTKVGTDKTKRRIIQAHNPFYIGLYSRIPKSTNTKQA